MAQFRETNHLRKFANEAGKQMRGPRQVTRAVAQDNSEFCKCIRATLITDKRICCSCGRKLAD